MHLSRYAYIHLSMTVCAIIYLIAIAAVGLSGELSAIKMAFIAVLLYATWVCVSVLRSFRKAWKESGSGTSTSYAGKEYYLAYERMHSLARSLSRGDEFVFTDHGAHVKLVIYPSALRRLTPPLIEVTRWEDEQGEECVTAFDETVYGLLLPCFTDYSRRFSKSWITRHDHATNTFTVLELHHDKKSFREMLKIEKERPHFLRYMSLAEILDVEKLLIGASSFLDKTGLAKDR